MPTNRVRKTRSARPDVSPTLWAMLNDMEMPPGFSKWEALNGISAEVWATFRDDILATWIATKPGRRPSHWWLHDAPRLPEDQHGDFAGAHFAKDLIIPRTRLGGKGTPSHEVLAYLPSYHLGIPTSWFTASDAVFYFPEGLGDVVEVFDAEDRPQFESQAAYLRRLGLFMPGERKRLKKADFEAETAPFPHSLENRDE